VTRRRSYPMKPGASPSPFALLNDEHQRASVCKLADSRLGDNAIAQLTGLDVQTVRVWLAERDIAERTK
jgi:hypothetical protein